MAQQKSKCPGEQLREALAERGKAVNLARDLDVDPSLVTRWIQRERKPNTAQRVKLEELFGIPILSWDRSSLSEEKGAA